MMASSRRSEILSVSFGLILISALIDFANGQALPLCTPDPCATDSMEKDSPCGELPLCTPWTGTTTTSPAPTTTQAVEALRRLLKAGFRILPPENRAFPGQYGAMGFGAPGYPPNPYAAGFGGFPPAPAPYPPAPPMARGFPIIPAARPFPGIPGRPGPGRLPGPAGRPRSGGYPNFPPAPPRAAPSPFAAPGPFAPPLGYPMGKK